MILEGLVTTTNGDGTPNLAPMGPEVGPDMKAIVLRPFRTATTFRNLVHLGEGVLHVTDDALMLALAAIGEPTGAEFGPASEVRGYVVLGACRYHEFRVVAIDDREDRASIRAEVVATGHLRDFYGWNRGKHAVLEAAILATRAGFLPLEPIAEEFARLAPLVSKTGGPAEFEAFARLARFVRLAAAERGRDDLDIPSP